MTATESLDTKEGRQQAVVYCCRLFDVFDTAYQDWLPEKISSDRENPVSFGFNRSSLCCTVINHDTFLTSSDVSVIRMTKISIQPSPRIAERFAELVREMVRYESEAALAVLFQHSVTAINNWYKGRKLPRDRDIEEFAERCGVSGEELRTPDPDVWKAVLGRVAAEAHVIVTPAWLQLGDRVSVIEKSIRADGVIILTADAYNDTQRLSTQEDVRHNIMRGVNYFYVVPEGCENERSLTRFVESLKSLNASGKKMGAAKIIKTRRNRKTIRQWKRIDHVMLFASGQNLSEIDNLPDLAQLRIDYGHEQLYKAGDQPYGEFAWKTLSVREIDYYKELLEEWGSIDDDEGESQQIMNGLKLIGGLDDGRAWEKNNVEGVEYVYNTLYRSQEGTNARYAASLDEIIEIMDRCMEQGSQWVDLGLFGQEAFIRQGYERLSPKYRTAYSAAVIPADVPVIQMRCLSFRNNRSAVLVGWGFPGSDVPKVFLSEDPGIVNYFKSYFNSIYLKARKIYEFGREL